MAADPDRIDEAALALLYLTLHDERRAWKSLPWSVTDRLYDKGLISDPKNKSKSVVFSDKGLEAAQRAYRKLFEAGE